MSVAFRIFVVGFLLFSAGVMARAQSFDDSSVEGVLFIQQHPYADDPASAWPVEYRSAAGNDKITIVIAKDGTRMRIASNQIYSTLPYPGRGGLTGGEAIQLCDDALLLYPGHSRLIRNIREAWVRVTPEDYATHAFSSGVRQSATAMIIARIAAQAESFKQQVVDAFSVPSVLDQLKLSPPKESASSDPAADYTKKAGGPADLDKNVDVIKDYYKRAGNLQNGGTP